MIMTMEQVERETKMDCRETNPVLGGRDLSFLRCQIGVFFGVDIKTHAPRFRLVAFGSDWKRALEMFKRNQNGHNP